MSCYLEITHGATGEAIGSRLIMIRPGDLPKFMTYWGRVCNNVIRRGPVDSQALVRAGWTLRWRYSGKSYWKASDPFQALVNVWMENETRCFRANR